jgi:hypothetical protein
MTGNPVGTGAKLDTGKTRYRHLMPEWLEAVARVLTQGADVHGDGSWRTIDEPVPRYRDALMRHLIQAWKGEYLDADSGLPHYAHIAVNAFFLLELEERARPQDCGGAGGGPKQ